MAFRAHSVAFAGLAVVGWFVAVDRMSSMDTGPGTPLGGAGWFLGAWAAMSVAMMAPSALPAFAVMAQVRGPRRAWPFAAAYLGAWLTYGAAAYGADRTVRAVAPPVLAWNRGGPWLAGGALVAAGLYQWSPLKQACLRHCRSPLSLALAPRGGVHSGLRFGAWCIGCCSGLMLALFAVGVMSVFWMAVAGAVIAAEKALPRGEATARVVAIVLIVLGVWMVCSPETVPG